jgi:hypothetical protein
MLDGQIGNFVGAMFYILSIFNSSYFIVYQTEKIADFIDKKSGKLKFLAQILIIVLFTSLAFASYNWCIYDYNPDSFRNVKGDNYLELYLDFFYYSLGVFIMNNNSSIEPFSFYSKLFTGTEMIFSFVALVLILANYADLKSPFNEHLLNKDDNKNTG